MNGPAKQWQLVSRCQPAESGPYWQLGACRHVGAASRRQGRSKFEGKPQRIGCSAVRYSVGLAAMLVSPRGLFFNACVPPVLMR